LSYPYPAQQTTGEPLANPWYTPGWTAQDPDYVVLPENEFNIQGFPAGATYVTVTANYFDNDGNPLSGYLSFWPSSPLQFTVNGVTTQIYQRRVGQNLWDEPGAYWGSGKIYLRNGNLLVNLLATDNAAVNMNPVTFTYHVKEHIYRGQEYDITVPSTSTSPVDIHTLTIPSVSCDDSSSVLRIAAISTQYVPVVVNIQSGGQTVNPTSDTVQFAFTQNGVEPSTWTAGAWIASSTPPYYAQILVGPSGAVTLTAGVYTIWVQVDISPQVAAFPAGTLVIY